MRLARRLPRSVAALLLVAVHEELGSSLPVAGADDVVAALQLSTTTYTLAVFAAPLLLATLVEAPLHAWSDRHRSLRPKLVAAGLVGVAAGLAVVAAACRFDVGVVVLGVGVTVCGVALGVSSGVAEAMVVDSDPERAEQNLTRFAAWSIVGDVVGPVVLAVCGVVGVGFVGAVAVVVAFTLVSAVVVVNVDNPAGGAADDAADADPEADPEADGVVSGVVAGRSLPRGAQPWLLVWLFGTALCALLDEALAAFTVLWAHQRWAPAWCGPLILTTFSLGAGLGALVAERQLARREPLRVLLVCAVSCAACFCVFLAVDAYAALVASAFFVGATAAPLFPIAKAQCHRALPGRPGLVNAAETLFAPIDVVTPVLLALLADRFGVGAALATLLLQPVALALLAFFGLRRRPHQLPDEPPPDE